MTCDAAPLPQVKINLYSSQPLSELTAKQIAARADEEDERMENANDDADDSEDGPITCKASQFVYSF